MFICCCEMHYNEARDFTIAEPFSNHRSNLVENIAWWRIYGGFPLEFDHIFPICTGDKYPNRLPLNTFQSKLVPNHISYSALRAGGLRPTRYANSTAPHLFRVPGIRFPFPFALQDPDHGIVSMKAFSIQSNCLTDSFTRTWKRNSSLSVWFRMPCRNSRHPSSVTDFESSVSGFSGFMSLHRS